MIVKTAVGEEDRVKEKIITVGVKEYVSTWQEKNRSLYRSRSAKYESH
ncbi:hypothetical protein [Methanosarcina horonobensis]|nr:hypothetical protein [Methanosarcina horonobensis]